jgi:hypothetical protein
LTKIGLLEWLKVKALSSSPSTAEGRKEGNKEHETIWVVINTCMEMS